MVTRATIPMATFQKMSEFSDRIECIRDDGVKMGQVFLYCLSKQVGDWKIRIDSPHGNVPRSQKHVHIIKKRVSGEYSWNVDGSRHDAHKFPASEQCIKAARVHAATALDIPVSSLSFIVAIPGGSRISLRSIEHAKYKSMPIFNSYVSKRLSLIFFGSPAGLVFVLGEYV
jgi:hypothetical protein